MRPMLAVRGTTPPLGEDWCHEVKWDGIRALVTLSEAVVRIETRNGNDVSTAFPELTSLRVRTSAGAVDRCVLDGEVVVLRNGIPSFAAVAARLHRGRGRATAASPSPAPAVLVVFDLLELEGNDIRALSLRERRSLLDDLSFEGAAVQLSPVHADGHLLAQATKAQGLEGIVSKRWSSPYRAGVRSDDWRKLPHRRRSSWVVGGWTEQAGGRGRLAALVVGEPRKGSLVFRGKVGTGFSAPTSALLLERLHELESRDCPFVEVDVPRGTIVRWIRPELVVEVESLGLTEHGKLRQPSFVGMRDDVSVEEVPGA